MSFFKILFSPKGRIRRRDYWLASIGFGVFIFAVEFLGHNFLFGLDSGSFFTDITSWAKGTITPFGVLLLGLMVVGIYPGFCIFVKRWHDRNRPTWAAILITAWNYGSIFLQMGAGAFSGQPNLAVSGAISILNGILGIYLFIECGCLDGTPGPNRYGPSPKGKGTSPAAVF